MAWHCPECESTELKVSVRVWADLIQNGENVETATEDNDHEWDPDSSMECVNCNYVGRAGDFEVAEADVGGEENGEDS